MIDYHYHPAHIPMVLLVKSKFCPRVLLVGSPYFDSQKFPVPHALAVVGSLDGAKELLRSPQMHADADIISPCFLL